MTVLDLDGHAAEVLRRGGVHLELDEDGDDHRRRRGAARAPGPGRPVAVPAAEALARQLARYRLATGALAQDLATVEATLPDLLGFADAAALDLGRLWRPRPQRDRLRVPIGVGADGGAGRAGPQGVRPGRAWARTAC